ncbi:MAG: hypothetical protein WCR67_00645 [Bacilli bacterium]
MENEEKREMSQKLHKQSQEQYDIQQNALCYVVIGGILMVIGVLFIFMAMKRENNILVGIDVTSIAFYIMVIALAGGVASMAYGLVRFFRARIARKAVLRQISSLK